MRQLVDSGKTIEDIEVEFCLTTINSLHAQWIVNMYNFFNSQKGSPVTVKGWKKAEIAGLFNGTTLLPPEDPFRTVLTSEVIFIGQPMMTSSLLAMVDVYSVMFMRPQPTTLVTINPKERNYVFSGTPTRVHHRPPGLTLTSVATW